LIAIDESGSVPDWMLELFFAELGSLTRAVSIDILPFDSHASESQIFTWKKGTHPQINRVKSGGTSFDAPTMIFNDPKNRGRWDGMLIATDGECGAPMPTRGKRGWILGKGHNLMFKTSELQVFVDKDKPMSGAWR
jgi:predicted metal-dependent peptidase